MIKYSLSKSMVRVYFLAAAGLMALAVPSALGQAGAASSSSSLSGNVPYVATMTFDVASVRENKSPDVQAGYTMSGQFVPRTTVLHVINWRIEDLISRAYGASYYQILDSPKWPFPTLFMVEAKSSSEADEKMASLTSEQQRAEQQHMLQALLEERFKLKTHWETKDGDVYNLVAAKGGPKLGAEGSTPPSADELNILKGRPVPPLRQKNDGRGYDFIGHGCSMEMVVSMLSTQFGRPVINKTGLAGKYDFVLKYRGRWDQDRAADDLDPMPPMDRALQEQLGLKVEAAKGPIKMLVIDHIEKPSEN